MQSSPSLFTGVKVQPRCFLAFELPTTAFAPTLKPYLFPHRRATLEGMSRGDLFFETIHSLPSSTTHLCSALEKVEDFLSNHEEISFAVVSSQNDQEVCGRRLKARGMTVEMLSFDCISLS